jgi:hypothetical protein
LPSELDTSPASSCVNLGGELVGWATASMGCEPVLRDGARALAASLARPPWSRSSP